MNQYQNKIINKVLNLISHGWKVSKTDIYLESSGFCPICNKNSSFVSKHEWLRDHFTCQNCGSIPRERALMRVIDRTYSNWAQLRIHESSPGNRGASIRIANECPKYIASQYFKNKEPGRVVNGIRCENIENLTFTDDSIDLHITQDVMEHVFDPEHAFKEIARTLKPGGAHIFTVPIVNKWNSTRIRAKLNEQHEVDHIQEPVYHGNPIDNKGSLVTIDWGFDICQFIFDSCGLFTHLIHIDDLSMGIRAEYIEVLVSVKPNSH